MRSLSAGNRLGAAFLDHVFMCVLAGFVMVPIMINTIAAHEVTVGHNIWLIYAVFAVYFCKDCVGGRSLAKRLLKQQVVNNNTGIAATSYQCLVRNLFIVIWPIELIMIMVNPERRLGDYVAGTKVVPFDYETEQPRINFVSVLISLAAAFAFIYLLVTYVLPHPGQDPRHVVKSTYNTTESQSLEKLFSDSMGTKLTAEVKIYDSIENHKLKFIHIKFYLKNNYLADASMTDSIRKKVTELILMLFPADSFTGFTAYIFKTGNAERHSANDIGVRVK